ncbi:MAG: hypothetical protein J07HQX50_02168 [Haloquadratum sp. J07HQX50]|nr:MAG: hypothetical protein J07HQX50_02168 [Haloquadratum sp. J07HQX50]
MTGVVSDAPTLVTPLTGVSRIHRVHKHASLFGFVLDTLLELTERSLRMPVSVPKTVSNTVELLENDAIVIVFKSFLYDSVCGGVQNMLDVFVFSPAHFLQGAVC